MLRRRRREAGEQPGPYEESQQNGGRYAGSGERGHPAGPAAGAAGPWDIADDYPRQERVDCGSLLIPVLDGFDVQIAMAVGDEQEHGSWVAVVRGESGMQLQAFAAPRSGGLWDDVRHEIAANIAESGGSCREASGPFGPELDAMVPVGDTAGPGEQGPAGQLHAVRFLGADGPRWFLRGVLSGPAATDPALRAPFDDVFGDVVVVRGDYPAPQRQQLEIRSPEEAMTGDEPPEDEEPGWGLANPFARGPEITETR